MIIARFRDESPYPSLWLIYDEERFFTSSGMELSVSNIVGLDRSGAIQWAPNARNWFYRSTTTVPTISRRTLTRFAIVLVVLAVVIANVVRDADIQADRDSYAALVQQYEKDVENSDGELKELEAESIAFEDLQKIANLQKKIDKTSKLLIELHPVNRYSRTSVESYNKNIRVYQSQMSELNSIIDRANQQYEISIITPSKLDRASQPTDKKFWEIVGLAQAPELGPSPQVEEINQGISARYEKQKAVRDKWNDQANKINGTTDKLNSLHERIYQLYGTKSGGINIQTGNYVKSDS